MGEGKGRENWALIPLAPFRKGGVLAWSGCSKLPREDTGRVPGFLLPDRVRDKFRKGGIWGHKALCPYTYAALMASSTLASIALIFCACSGSSWSYPNRCNTILRRDEALIFCAPFRKRERYDIGGSIHTSIGSIKFVDSFISGKRLTSIYLRIYQFY